MPTVPTLARSRRKLVFCRMVAFGWTTIGAPTHLISNLKARSWYGACLSLECCTPPKLVTKPLRWIVSLAKHGPAPHPSTWSFPSLPVRKVLEVRQQQELCRLYVHACRLLLLQDNLRALVPFEFHHFPFCVHETRNLQRCLFQPGYILIIYWLYGISVYRD